MTTIAVGGHSRNVGKTSIVAGLIRAFNQYSWTAVKISSHKHANIPALGSTLDSSIYDVYEESNRDGSADTSRFLAAGASRSLWIRIEEDQSEVAMQQILPILQSSPFVIIESNRITRALRPDLFIMVLRFDVEDFKDSARRALRQANAIVAVNPDSSPPPWNGIAEILSGIPQFVTPDPQILPDGLSGFVQAYLPPSRSLAFSK
jgi:hypothetical protein